jgi:hypothetical protein
MGVFGIILKVPYENFSLWKESAKKKLPTNTMQHPIGVKTLHAITFLEPG